MALRDELMRILQGAQQASSPVPQAQAGAPAGAIADYIARYQKYLSKGGQQFPGTPNAQYLDPEQLRAQVSQTPDVSHDAVQEVNRRAGILEQVGPLSDSLVKAGLTVNTSANERAGQIFRNYTQADGDIVHEYFDPKTGKRRPLVVGRAPAGSYSRRR